MNVPPTYQFCAIDGGGTGCRVVIAGPDGAIAARAQGGPANFATNSDQAAASVLGALGEAAAQLGLGAAEVRRLVAHAGLAGIMDPANARALAARLPFARCSVSDDRETSVVGALGLADGAVVAVGTGSFVAARQAGNLRFLGGWGLNTGDQASGAWLGRGLLEQTLLAHDGLGDHSDLTRATLAHFSGSPARIVAFAAGAAPADYAALAPRVVTAAEAGDAVARALMQRGAAYLNAALDAVGVAGGQVICLIGGLGPQYRPFLAPGFVERLCPPAGTALDGALALARRHLHTTQAPG